MPRTFQIYSRPVGSKVMCGGEAAELKKESPDQGRILIVGCGGIGGVLGASLHRASVPICIATTNPEVRETWTSTGPYLGRRKAGGALDAAYVRETARDFPHKFGTIFVAVQPPQIEEVTRGLTDCLTPHGRVVCLSNGLCEEQMTKILACDKVVGAVVSWGARMKSPGHYTRTSKGGFRLGVLDDHADRQLEPIALLLRQVGPVRFTSNLRGARWSKLTINTAVTALGTIGGKTLGELLLRTEARHLALALMRETAQVAAAEGITLEPVTNIDLAKLARGAASGKKLAKAGQHALLLAVGARYRKLRSSMLAAMERGREPAIDHINGEVVARGAKHGIPTPYNQAATEVVWAIYRKEISPGPEALKRVKVLASR